MGCICFAKMSSDLSMSGDLIKVFRCQVMNEEA